MECEMSGKGDLRCETCRFWQRLDPDGEGWAADRNYAVGDDGVGICRRHPPAGQRRDTPPDHGKWTVTDATDAALWAQWPVTDGEADWCGDHYPRDREG